MWPIREAKQTREFRSICLKWLEQLKKENAIPIQIPVRRSYLEENKGEGFSFISIL